MTQSPVTMFNRWLRQSGGLPAQSADLALDASVVRRFQADDVLFSAGDRPDVLYFIQSGLVRFFYLTDDGKEFNKNFVAAGSVVTSLSTFLSGVPSPFFTQALEDTVTIALPMEFVRRQVEADIHWERLLSRSVAMLALKKEQREASFLLQDAGADQDVVATHGAESSGPAGRGRRAPVPGPPRPAPAAAARARGPGRPRPAA